MKDNGLVTKTMGLVFTCIKMELNTKGTGSTTLKTAMEKKFGKTGANTRESTKTAKNMGRGNTNGLT